MQESFSGSVGLLVTSVRKARSGGLTIGVDGDRTCGAIKDRLANVILKTR